MEVNRLSRAKNRGTIMDARSFLATIFSMNTLLNSRLWVILKKGFLSRPSLSENFAVLFLMVSFTDPKSLFWPSKKLEKFSFFYFYYFYL